MSIQESKPASDQAPTCHVLYPFQISTSQGGLFSAAQVTGNASLPDPFQKLVFHSADTEPFMLGRREVRPVTNDGKSRPFDPWFRQDFLLQHLQAYTEMIPAWMAREIYRDHSIANPGSIEYLSEFFKKHPVDLALDEAHSARFGSALHAMKAEDVVSIQGPVWFMPFIRENSQKMRDIGVRHVQFEHQLIPEKLDQTLLGQRLLPCYQQADVLFFHTSVYADRLANMLKGPLPDMRTVDLGIDKAWVDQALARVSQPGHIQAWKKLTEQQQELITAVFQAKESITHRFICFDRLDPMKGTHTVIAGIKMFLDEARQIEGEGYRDRYQFASIHELLNVDNYAEMSPKNQYIRVCKELYADLQREHPGMLYISDSFTNQHGHRDILPAMIRGSTVLALHGQDGLGLSALEGAYINRNEDVGLIVGDQAGCYLEADKRGFGKLVHGVEAGNPVAVKDAIWQVVRLRERSPGFLAENNSSFAREYVSPRTGTMALT